MKTVLVTGSNRSGTTWVGQMLALSGKFLEVYEPFNHLVPAPIVSGPCPFKNHYHYVLEPETSAIKRYINRRVIGSIYTGLSTFSGLSEDGAQTHQMLDFFRIIDNLYGILMKTKRILIKDPIALLSADWIAREYSAQVVVLIRHPAAYVSSIKRLNWDMSLDSFISQKQFMDTLPASLASEIITHMKNQPQHTGYNLEAAALSWKVFHHVIYRYKKLYPDWVFIKHEDLCRDFMGGFRGLYAKLSLPWSEKVQKIIPQYCNHQNQTPLNSEIHVLRRESRSIPQLWKSSLNKDEINQIREITSDVANFFYNDTSWEQAYDPN